MTLRAALLRRLLCLALLIVSGSALAVIETYQFSNPELEQRYRVLSQELRCPKCQNQNIADSDAAVAQDLRRQLHQQLEAGASDEEILDYMVARYGDFVRYRPAMHGATLILWLVPAILLLIAVIVVVVILRGRRTEPAVLSEAEERRLAALLDEDTSHEDSRYKNIASAAQAPATSSSEEKSS